MDIKYFYHDTINPIMKGAIDTAKPITTDAVGGKTYIPMLHLNDNDQVIGHMQVQSDRIFETRDACLDYARKMGAFEPEDITVTPCTACVRMGMTCDGRIQFSDGEFGIVGGCAAGLRRTPV